MTGTAVPVKFFRYPERKRYIPIQGKIMYNKLRKLENA